MSRRVGLPGASELFRPTTARTEDAERPGNDPVPSDDGTPSASGRVRHDEKITVYISSEELLALEQARLALRAEHGVAVDRGRIVRAAISDALSDLADNGSGSALVQRLKNQ